MDLDKNEVIHELNNLTVKIKSICSLILSDDDCGIDISQMVEDGDKTLEDLNSLWKSLKENL